MWQRPVVRVVAMALGLAASAQLAAPTARAAGWPTQVSPNHRYLLDARGEPFFYLGDTAWELFHRPSLDEADRYLRDRAAKHFTVIQAVVLAEYAGLVEPNANGDLPLRDNDPTKPVEAYFRHVDAVVDRAEDLGLVVGMLPTWGDKWNKKWGQGPEIFTPANAAIYGEFLGDHYKDKPIVWILGGDRPVESEDQKAILRAMAAGLKKGDGGRHLMTFHPPGGSSSSAWFHGDDWLAFNMAQTGHNYGNPNYNAIAADYARTPPKPCLDAEPGYEDHPAAFLQGRERLPRRPPGPQGRLLGPVRRRPRPHLRLPRHLAILQPQPPPRHLRPHPWTEAIHLPGAGQMQHARALVESRPFLTRIPDPSLLTSDPGKGPDHTQATRADDGSYAFIYSATGHPFTVDLEKLSGPTLKAWWYDPRLGTAAAFGSFPRQGRHEFTPPSNGKGNDWVLVLDDEAKGYYTPGKVGR